MLDGLGQFILNHYEWRHFLIAGGMFIQWEVTMILSMYLLVNGYLGWGGFLISIIIGMTAYETTLYWVGRSAKGTRIGRFIERKIPHRAHLESHLLQNANVILFLSKFVPYLNSATVMLAGWLKMPFKKYAKIRVIANIFWLIILGFISFSLMSSYSLVEQQKFFKRFEIGVFVVILLIILISKKIAKRAILKTIHTEKKLGELGEEVEKKLTKLDS